MRLYLKSSTNGLMSALVIWPTAAVFDLTSGGGRLYGFGRNETGPYYDQDLMASMRRSKVSFSSPSGARFDTSTSSRSRSG